MKAWLQPKPSSQVTLHTGSEPLATRAISSCDLVRKGRSAGTPAAGAAPPGSRLRPKPRPGATGPPDLRLVAKVCCETRGLAVGALVQLTVPPPTRSHPWEFWSRPRPAPPSSPSVATTSSRWAVRMGALSSRA